MSAFGSSHDPRVLGSSPTSLLLRALSLFCVRALSLINKILKKGNMIAVCRWLHELAFWVQRTALIESSGIEGGLQGCGRSLHILIKKITLVVALTKGGGDEMQDQQAVGRLLPKPGKEMVRPQKRQGRVGGVDGPEGQMFLQLYVCIWIM